MSSVINIFEEISPTLVLVTIHVEESPDDPFQPSYIWLAHIPKGVKEYISSHESNFYLVDEYNNAVGVVSDGNKYHLYFIEDNKYSIPMGCSHNFIKIMKGAYELCEKLLSIRVMDLGGKFFLRNGTQDHTYKQGVLLKSLLGQLPLPEEDKATAAAKIRAILWFDEWNKSNA